MIGAFDYYNITTAVLALICGACAGSFINAAAMRAAAGREWWGAGRSACDSCDHALGAADLVPLLSFVALRGRCRYCGARIKPRHFAAEVISGALAAALFQRWGFSYAMLMGTLVLWFSLFNSLTDLETGYIFDLPALALGAAGLLLRITAGMQAVIDGVLGAALGFGFIALIILISRGGMGWGDALLMAGIGGALGWKFCAFGMYLGFIIGGVVVVPLLAAKKLKRKDAVPLGPFLAVGCVWVLFSGSAIVRHFGGIIGYNPGWPWW